MAPINAEQLFQRLDHMQDTIDRGFLSVSTEFTKVDAQFIEVDKRIKPLETLTTKMWMIFCMAGGAIGLGVKLWFAKP